MKLATRIIRIYRVFSYPTFQRMQLYGQNGSVSIIVIKEILLFNVIGLMLCTGIENGCYEHIPLVKLGEGKQWIQLKRILIKGLVPTPNTIVQHFFPAGISQAKNGELLICCLFHALEMYLYSLSLHTTKFALFLSYKNRTNCSFHLI